MDMADIDAGAGVREPKRYTILAVLAMLGASVVALAIGIGGLSLWASNLTGYAPSLARAGDDPVQFAIYAFLSAGPVVAGLALVLGWVAFMMFGAPRAGRKIVFYPPVIWGVLLLAYLAIVTTACGGRWTCRL